MAGASSEPPRVRYARRAPALDRAAVVSAALGLARREGLAAVSMRRLADELGAAPMSLYRHVQDREDLLLHMLGVVANAVGAPPEHGEPRERLTAIMLAVHAAFERDPWVVQVLATEGLASPLILPVIDTAFGALAEAGLSPDAARQAYALLFEFAFGEILNSHHDRPDTYWRQIVSAVDPVEFPHLSWAMTGSGPERNDYFAVNLARLLDGILGPA